MHSKVLSTLKHDIWDGIPSNVDRVDCVSHEEGAMFAVIYGACCRVPHEKSLHFSTKHTHRFGTSMGSALGFTGCRRLLYDQGQLGGLRSSWGWD